MKRLFISIFMAIFCVFVGANAGFAATYDVTYACGDGTGDAPAPTTATSESAFTPAANTCIAPTDYTFAGWAVSDTDDTVSDAFTWNYDEDKTLTATYRPTYFTVTTTSLTSGDEFRFKISAAGTFNVDCGTDGVLSGDGVSGTTITRANTTQATYTCTYSSGGVKNIKFTGTATAYSTATDASGAAVLFGGDTTGLTPELIASISGSVGGVFPTLGQNAGQQPIFYNTFKGSSSLTSIPAGLFSGISGGAVSMFNGTFMNCTSLTTIPSGLFDGITMGAANMFNFAFSDCSSLTAIPSGLFDGITTGANYMFYGTFRRCTSLAGIPAGLFSGITTGANQMFRDTFIDCSSLTALPENLFSGVTTGANGMFQATFKGCSKLSGYIPPNMFAGLVANNAPIAWNETFNGTKLATVCPTGTQQYITGYEGFTANSTWNNGYVSCEPSDLSCTGATFATNNQCTPCPTGYTSDTTDGKTTQSQCKISCAAGTYIAAAGDTTCTTVEVGYYIGATDFKYGQYNKRNGCGTGRTTLSTGSTSESACVCDGATYMNNGTCIDCPAGYTANTAPGKTAAEQCQIHCNAGTWLSNVGNPSCSNVGLGFYTAASDVYYGQIGTRDKCASGLITATDTSTSVSDCITSNSPCTGATYYDGSSCVACPNGYDHNTDDGKVSVHQCQISCAAGTYVKTATHAYTLLEYLENTGTSYVNTGYNHTSANIRGEIRIGSPSTGAVSGNSNFLGTQGNGAGYSFGWNGGFKMWVESANSNITGANYAIAQGATADVAYELTGTTRKIEWPTNQHKDGTHTGLGSQSPLWLFNAKDQSNRFFKGKIYYFRLYENGELVGEWLPARRQSDNKLGMFDTVNETFVEATVRNNTMLAGPEVNSDCVAVGKGYYAPASVIDYGSIGSKFACPAGTYQGTENGTSLASCLACTGATYSDSPASAACTACPTGYNYNTTSNKTSVNQCQVQCAAGTYVAPDYTELEYIEATGAQYIDTIVLANTYVNPIVTMTMEYTELTGDAGTGTEKIYIRTNIAGTKFMANAGGTEVELGDADTNKHTFVINTVNGTVSIDGTPTALTPSTLDAKEFYIGRRNASGPYVRGKYYGINIISDGNVMFNMIPVRRESDGVVGMLNTVTNVFYPNTSVATFIAGPDTEDATGTAGCVSAEAGYYAPQSSVVNYGDVSPSNARVACPIGTYSTTIGATSSSTCTSCAGATYNDETGMASCKACPTGYTANTTAGKDEVTDCQISCAAGTSVKTEIPATTYVPLEYIEATGTQYINTNIKPSQLTNPIVSLTAQYTQVEASKFSGSNNTNNSAKFLMGIDSSQNFFVQTTGSGSATTFGSADTNKHTFVIDIANQTASLDNTTSPLVTDSWNTGNTIRINKDLSNSSSIGKMKIYHFNIISNGAEFMNLVPVRRISDGVLGMYDTVGGGFYTNAGSGTFLAGNDDYSVVSCTDVGTGHWIAANIVNYGSVSAAANACPIGTYSDVTNAGSLAACTSCAGATYNDETGMAACKACPTGYDYNTTSGKTAANQCQVHCDAGTYVRGTYTRLEYIESSGTQYISTGVKLKDTVNPIMSVTMQPTIRNYSTVNGIDWSGTARFNITIRDNKYKAYSGSNVVELGDADTNKHTFVISAPNGTASMDDTTLPLTIDLYQGPEPLYINRGYSSGGIGYAKYYNFNVISDGVQIRNMIPVRRNSDGAVGMLDTVNDVFYGNAGTGTFFAGPDLTDVNDSGGAVCMNVGTGYYSSASTVNYGSVSTRTACPVGTYSDVPNGASCQSCSGATYADTPGAAACTACPTGYTANIADGKDEITDCQISCAAGTYLAPLLPTEYTRLEYIESTGSQHIATGIAIKNTVNPVISMTLQYTVAERNKLNGAASEFWLGIHNNGQFAAKANSDAVTFGYADLNKHTFVLNTANSTASLDNTTLPITVGDFSTLGNSFFINHNGSYDSFKGRAKYYHFSLISDGVQIRNMVPAKRNSDNVVGMYDLVNDVFYGPASGTFIAGPIASGDGASCTNVGTGHWAAASTLNYNTLGARNACPVGTYSDITNGTSAAACTACTGATYNDTPGAAACEACPTGYTYNTTAGKDEITDCQIHCDAGYFLSPVPTTDYIPLEYIIGTGTQYIDTGIAVNSLTNPIMSVTMKHNVVRRDKQTAGAGEFYLNMYDNFKARAGANGTVVTFSGAPDTNKHTFVLNTQNATTSVDDTTLDLTVGDLSTESRTILVGQKNGNGAGAIANANYYHFSLTSGGRLVMNLVPVIRKSDDAVGMFDTVSGTFYGNAGTGTFLAGSSDPHNIESVGNGNYCVPVGTGWWVGASTVNYGDTGATRNACPVGTYSDITTGASAAACTACAGATYNDTPGAAACTACPTGYTANTTAGKDEIYDCQINCAAGTYLDTLLPSEYTQLTYIESTAGTDTYIYVGKRTNELVAPIMSATFQLTSVTSTQYIGSDTRWRLTVNGNGQFVANAQGVGTATFAFADTNKHTIVMDAQNLTATLDDKTLPLAFGNLDGEIRINTSGNGLAKYYSFSLISDGVLIRDMVPAKRNSDNAVGMYDLVNGVFYASGGENPFVAGTPIPLGQSSCTNAGTGHWAPGATLNYGQSNPNSLNICPVGTYSAIETGSSANDCLSCSGATFNDTPGAAACTACPTGYDYNTTNGKDEITDCQIHCDAGTFAGSLVPDGYTELEYIQTTGTQYINTGVAMNTLVNPTMSLTMQYDSTTSGQQNGIGGPPHFKVGIAAGSATFICQAGGNNTDVAFGAADTNKHTFVLNTANATCSLDGASLPITVADFSAHSSTFWIGRINNDPAKSSSAKYYHFSMTSDGVLIRDMVPAKRDSDDAVGMYDLVNDVFYPNAGTGDIVAGRAVGGSECRNVGTGYWATASTLNFGTLGTRTACPVGTYSPIETGASAAACLSCPGATYGDETAAAACKSCPVNYDYNTTSGKTAENQCQTHCDAGTYVSTVIPDAYTQLEYIESTGTQYIDTGIYARNYVNPIMILDMQYTTVETGKYNGAIYCEDCQNFYVGIDGDGKFTIKGNKIPSLFGDADTNRHTFVLDKHHATASVDSVTTSLQLSGPSSIGHLEILIGGAHDGYKGGEDTSGNKWLGKAKYYQFKFISNGVEIRNMIPVRRNSDNVAGMYDTVNNKFYASASEDAFIAGPATACVTAGYGHYSAAATVDYGSTNANTLGACPVGKYSDILNGTSISACQSCSGATYANTTGMKNCTACPTGYNYNTTSGKTAVNQCQIHCDAGTYLMNTGNLPSGYTQLPYIESTGNQYINTGIALNSLTNPVMSLTVQYTQVVASRQFGVAASPVLFLAGINSNSKFACQAGDSSTEVELGNPDTNMHTFVVDTANATCSLDGVSSPLTVGSLDSASTIKLFSAAGDARYTSKAKLYSFSLISNGTTVMNLVPVKRDADDKIGMYDTIGNTFYINMGTGTFVAPQTGCTGVESGYYAAASTVNYGATYVDTHNACPAGYDYSAAGVAGAQTDCYAMCTVSDVPHATAATGGKYYGGNTTCEPLDSNSCDTNYRYVAASGNNLAQCLADLININWGDANGGVWATTQCEYGGTITTPTTAPTKRGHTFVGWRFVAPTPEPEQTLVDPGE